MEKTNNQNCKGLFSRCHGEPAASKSVTNTEIKNVKAETTNTISTETKKPWSVFGDLYWI